MSVDFLGSLENSFEHLYKNGAFLTASDGEKANTMTISWGMVGYIWRRPIFVALVRNSRYTLEFLEKGDSYTISIPYSEEMKKALAVCGSKSGRDIDKEEVAKIKFLKSKSVESPIVSGCNKYYECKVLFKGEMDKALLPKEILDSFYSDNDMHKIFLGEILEAYDAE